MIPSFIRTSFLWYKNQFSLFRITNVRMCMINPDSRSLASRLLSRLIHHCSKRKKSRVRKLDLERTIISLLLISGLTKSILKVGPHNPLWTSFPYQKQAWTSPCRQGTCLTSALPLRYHTSQSSRSFSPGTAPWNLNGSFIYRTIRALFLEQALFLMPVGHLPGKVDKRSRC